MTDQTEPRLSKLPFFVGDGVLVLLAVFIYWQGKLPLTPWEITAVLVCCVVGACLMVAPFLIEYQGIVRKGEAASLTSSLEQIKDLQSLAALIGAATARWQTVQEQSDKTVVAAKNVSERMTSEVAGFTEFLQKANDGERANLRIEVEKLKRAEADWVQSIVAMLDHIYALNQAAARSGQTALIDQLGKFQNACRDIARRVGLAPFAPAPDETFNPKLHQLADDSEPPACESKIDQTIATGFTFQGRMVRPAIVLVRPQVSANEPKSAARNDALSPNGKPAAKPLPDRTLL
jgi:molecular chaperone GrpE (heat shock protein)